MKQQANPLAKFTATFESGAAFVAVNEGTFATITPLTAKAEAWLQTHAAPDATWLCDALIVEHRYFPDLADAIIAAGFLFERDALPN